MSIPDAVKRSRDTVAGDPVRPVTVKRFDGCPHCKAKMDQRHATWCRDFKARPT